MKKIQIHNMFIYLGIMLIDNKLQSMSPDYIKEKTLKFFGRLGKSEFVRIPIKNRNFDFELYCNTWKINRDDFELINIINFINDTVTLEKKKVFYNFRKYIGETDCILSKDLSHLAHTNISKYIDELVNFNDRFCKLHELREKLGY